jgi:Hg(II)-responsive transcriptional regulator
MKIGEVAAAAGVHVETLRYYERRGLLAEPKRTRAGYREYPGEAVARLRFIKRAQELGFTLAEIEELLALREARAGSCAEVRAAAGAKIEGIDRKLRALAAMRAALGELVETCDREGSARRCPLLESLDDADRRGS